MQDKTIVCLKYGTKYSSDYVNKLYQMSLRHCNYNYKFVCLTDDPLGLNSNISSISLNTYDDIQGWWYKTFLFDPSYGLQGSILFIDLDVVIFSNIDKFFDYETETFCISRGFRKDNKYGMNSSCFRFNAGTHKFIYDDFMKDRSNIMKRLHGDQDWIQEKIFDFNFWPDSWLMSYKWDMYKEGKVNYEDATSIAVFHGEPKPHKLETLWIKENWR
jgi:hypothetical protein